MGVCGRESFDCGVFFWRLFLYKDIMISKYKWGGECGRGSLGYEVVWYAGLRAG